jgi:cytochrome P450
MAASDLDFDLDDPSFIADPYPVYARLRDEAPVHHLPRPDLWVVSRHDDVLAALREPVTFSSDLNSLARDLKVDPFNPSIRVPRGLTAVAARIPWVRVLLTSDPPEHTVLRRKVSRAFTPKTIAAWEPRVREIAEGLVDGLVASGTARPVDLVRGLASPLPTAVIAEMMGVPLDRQDDFKRWSDNLVGGLVMRGSIRKMLTSGVEISAFFARMIRRRRRRPGDDLISVLLTGGSEALTAPELVTFCVLLLVAGNETTTNLVSNGVVALFDHPDVRSRLEDDPTLAPAVVEETLRYDGPAQGLIRATTTDVTIAGTTIPSGSKVLLLVGSANRDPHHWSDPDRFVLDRQPLDHLDFGSGIHLCIGAALARLEGRVALETLFRRTRLAPGGTPARVESPVLRGLRSLPVTVEQKEAAVS